MSRHHELDERLDVTLRALGSEIPQPVPPREVRDELLAAVGVTSADGPQQQPIVPKTVRRLIYALAAGLVLAGGLAIWAQINATRLRWRVDQLQSQASPVLDFVPAGSPRYIAVNVFHPRCPRAQAMHPRFKALAGRCMKTPVMFMTLDIERGDCRAAAAELGVGCIFDDDRFRQTGTVQVVDTASHEIVLSVGYDDDLAALEQLLDETAVN